MNMPDFGEILRERLGAQIERDYWQAIIRQLSSAHERQEIIRFTGDAWSANRISEDLIRIGMKIVDGPPEVAAVWLPGPTRRLLELPMLAAMLLWESFARRGLITSQVPFWIPATIPAFTVLWPAWHDISELECFMDRNIHVWQKEISFEDVSWSRSDLTAFIRNSGLRFEIGMPGFTRTGPDSLMVRSAYNYPDGILAVRCQGEGDLFTYFMPPTSSTTNNFDAQEIQEQVRPLLEWSGIRLSSEHGIALRDWLAPAFGTDMPWGKEELRYCDVRQFGQMVLRILEILQSPNPSQHTPLVIVKPDWEIFEYSRYPELLPVTANEVSGFEAPELHSSISIRPPELVIDFRFGNAMLDGKRIGQRALRTWILKALTYMLEQTRNTGHFDRAALLEILGKDRHRRLSDVFSSYPEILSLVRKPEASRDAKDNRYILVVDLVKSRVEKLPGRS